MTPIPVTTQEHRPRVPLLAVAAIAAISLFTASCADDEDTASNTIPPEQNTSQEVPEENAVASTDDEGTTSIDEALLIDELDALPAATVSDTDRDGLAFMREEEKLALDVYTALYDVWGLRIFDNIAGAEQTHTDSVRTLLDRFGVADPALDQPPGVFTNPELQALYDDLVVRGSESVTEALLVGALIEDLDIADLQARASDDPAIALVYDNLERGSRNHLRAFIRQLDANGATYTPSYISRTDFDEIISSPTERGNGK